VIARIPSPCSPSADLPFEERRALWRERLADSNPTADAVVQVYRDALAQCEAPGWRDRGALLVMLVERLGAVADRVLLFKKLLDSPRAADIVYRAIMTRVHTAEELRELHDALGLREVDPGILANALGGAKTPIDRVRIFRTFVAAWPDDLELALDLLDAYEDAGDDAGGRALSRRLRRRSDATTRVRTAIGEYYLRLAARSRTPEHGGPERDVTEARRTFGEIVEFAPDDPGARRRLGDLLRAHGWYEEALRQYETLAKLVPEDTSVMLLRAAAAEGMGHVEEAVQWTEKAPAAGSPDGASPLARTSRAMASAFLAWAHDDAVRAGRADEAERLRERAARLSSIDGPPSGTVRVVLTWSHPELRPELWSNVLGEPMPVTDGDPVLGIEQLMVPTAKSDSYVELRLDHDDAEQVARLGVEAEVTAIVDEGTAGERVARLTVSFAPVNGKVLARRRVRIEKGLLREEAL
jgi:Ca-activated chloride channel family protein